MRRKRSLKMRALSIFLSLVLILGVCNVPGFAVVSADAAEVVLEDGGSEELAVEEAVSEDAVSEDPAIAAEQESVGQGAVDRAQEVIVEPEEAQQLAAPQKTARATTSVSVEIVNKVVGLKITASKTISMNLESADNYNYTLTLTPLSGYEKNSDSLKINGTTVCKIAQNDPDRNTYQVSWLIKPADVVDKKYVITVEDVDTSQPTMVKTKYRVNIQQESGVQNFSVYQVDEEGKIDLTKPLSTYDATYEENVKLAVVPQEGYRFTDTLQVSSQKGNDVALTTGSDTITTEAGETVECRYIQYILKKLDDDALTIQAEMEAKTNTVTILNGIKGAVVTDADDKEITSLTGIPGKAYTLLVKPEGTSQFKALTVKEVKGLTEKEIKSFYFSKGIWYVNYIMPEETNISLTFDAQEAEKAKTDITFEAGEGIQLFTDKAGTIPVAAAISAEAGNKILIYAKAAGGYTLDLDNFAATSADAEVAILSKAKDVCAIQVTVPESNTTVAVNGAVEDQTVYHTVTLPENVEGVTFCGQSKVADGEDYKLTLKLASGYELGTLKVICNGNEIKPDVPSTDGIYSYTCTDAQEDLIFEVSGTVNKNVQLLFEAGEGIKLSGDATHTISDTGVMPVKKGEQVSITVTPADGYKLNLDALAIKSEKAVINITKKTATECKAMVTAGADNAVITVTGAAEDTHKVVLPADLENVSFTGNTSVKDGNDYVLKAETKNGFSLEGLHMFCNGDKVLAKATGAGTYEYVVKAVNKDLVFTTEGNVVEISRTVLIANEVKGLNVTALDGSILTKITGTPGEIYTFTIEAEEATAEIPEIKITETDDTVPEKEYTNYYYQDGKWYVNYLIPSKDGFKLKITTDENEVVTDRKILLKAGEGIDLSNNATPVPTDKAIVVKEGTEYELTIKASEGYRLDLDALKVEADKASVEITKKTVDECKAVITAAKEDAIVNVTGAVKNIWNVTLPQNRDEVSFHGEATVADNTDYVMTAVLKQGYEIDDMQVFCNGKAVTPKAVAGNPGTYEYTAMSVRENLVFTTEGSAAAESRTVLIENKIVGAKVTALNGDVITTITGAPGEIHTFIIEAEDANAKIPEITIKENGTPDLFNDFYYRDGKWYVNYLISKVENVKLTLETKEGTVSKERKIIFEAGEGIILKDQLDKEVDSKSAIIVPEGNVYAFSIEAAEGYVLDLDALKVESDKAQVNVTQKAQKSRAVVTAGTEDAIVKVSGAVKNDWKVTLPENLENVSFQGAASVANGKPYTMTAVLNKGYEIGNIKVFCNGTQITGDEQADGTYAYRVDSADQDLVFTVTGAPEKSLLTNVELLFKAGEGIVLKDKDGNELSDGSPIKAEENSKVVFTIEAAEGYKLDLDALTASADHADVNITKKAAAQCTAVVTVGKENSVISVAGAVKAVYNVTLPIDIANAEFTGDSTVKDGEDYTLTATLRDGYTLEGLQLFCNGKAVSLKVKDAANGVYEYVAKAVTEDLVFTTEGSATAESITVLIQNNIQGANVKSLDGTIITTITGAPGAIYTFLIEAEEATALIPDIDITENGAAAKPYSDYYYRDGKWYVNYLIPKENGVNLELSTATGAVSRMRNIIFEAGEGIVLKDTTSKEVASQESVEVPEGGEYAFTIEAAEGYILDLNALTVEADKAQINVTKKDDTCTAVVTAGKENAVVKVNGAVKALYHVTLPENMDSVSFYGDKTVPAKQGYTMTAVLKEGYTLNNLKVFCNGKVVEPKQADGSYEYTVDVVTSDLVFTTSGEPALKTSNVAIENKIQGANITDANGNVITKINGVPGDVYTFIIEAERITTEIPELIITEKVGTDENTYYNFYLKDKKWYVNYVIPDNDGTLVLETKDGSGSVTAKRNILFTAEEGILIKDKTGTEIPADAAKVLNEGEEFGFTIEAADGYLLDLDALTVTSEKADVVLTKKNAKLCSAVVTAREEDAVVTISGAVKAIFQVTLPEDMKGVSFQGSQTAAYQSNYTMTAVLDQGYRLGGLQIFCNGKPVQGNMNPAGYYEYIVEDVKEDLVFTATGAPVEEINTVLIENHIDGANIKDLQGNVITQITDAPGKIYTFTIEAEKDTTKLPELTITEDANGTTTDYNNFYYKDGKWYVSYIVSDVANTKLILDTVDDSHSVNKDRNIIFEAGEGIVLKSAYGTQDVINPHESIVLREGAEFGFIIEAAEGYKLDPNRLQILSANAQVNLTSNGEISNGVVTAGTSNAVVTVTGAVKAVYDVTLPDNLEGVRFTGIVDDNTKVETRKVADGETYILCAQLADGYELNDLQVFCNGRRIAPIKDLNSAGLITEIEPADDLYCYIVKDVDQDLVFTTTGAPKKIICNVNILDMIDGTIVTDASGKEITMIENISWGECIEFYLETEKEGTTLPEIEKIKAEGEATTANPFAGDLSYVSNDRYKVSGIVLESGNIIISTKEQVSTVENTVQFFVQEGLNVAISGLKPVPADPPEKIRVVGSNNIVSVGSVLYGEDLSLEVNISDPDLYRFTEEGIRVTVVPADYVANMEKENSVYSIADVKAPILVIVSGVEKIPVHAVTLPDSPAIDVTAFDVAGGNPYMVNDRDNFCFGITKTDDYSNSIVTLYSNGNLGLIGAADWSSIAPGFTKGEVYRISDITEDVMVGADVQDYVEIVDPKNVLNNQFTITTIDQDVTAENQESLAMNQSLYVPTKTMVTYTIHYLDADKYDQNMPAITYTDANNTNKAVKLVKIGGGKYTFTIATQGNATINITDELIMNQYQVTEDSHSTDKADIMVGTEELNDVNGKVEYGEDFVFTVRMDDKYDPDSIVVSANGIILDRTPAGNYVIKNITEDQKIKISNPVVKTYTVTLPTKVNGLASITPSGENVVEYDDTFRFTLTKEDNYLNSSPTFTIADAKGNIATDEKGQPLEVVTVNAEKGIYEIRNIKANLFVGIAMDQYMVRVERIDTSDLTMEEPLADVDILWQNGTNAENPQGFILVESAKESVFKLNYDTDKYANPVVKLNGTELVAYNGLYTLPALQDNAVMELSLDRVGHKLNWKIDSLGIRIVDSLDEGGKVIAQGVYETGYEEPVTKQETVTVPYGKDFTFYIKKDDNYDWSKVELWMTDAEGNTTELKPNADGSYTIGSVISECFIEMKSFDKVVIKAPLAILNGYVIPYVVDNFSDGQQDVTKQEMSVENNTLTFFAPANKRFQLEVNIPEGYNKSKVSATANKMPMNAYHIPFETKDPDGNTVVDQYFFTSAAAIKGNTVVELGVVEKNQYVVTLPVNPGITIATVTGNPNAIDYDGTYQFTVTKNFGYTQSDIRVYTQENGKDRVLLNPDAKGIYTISHIKQNQKVTVDGVRLNTYTVTYPTITGLNVETVRGYNKDVVTHGTDFKFKPVLQKGYKGSRITVKVDGNILQPDANGIYTIKNVTDFKKVDITGVRHDVEIVVDDETLYAGQLTHAEVQYVPEKSSLRFHCCTPTRGTLDEDGNLYAIKGGTITLVAITYEYGEKVVTKKDIKVKRNTRVFKKTDGTYKVGDLYYEIVKQASGKKTGVVRICSNQNYNIIPNDLVIPGKVKIKGKTYRVGEIEAGAFHHSDLTSVYIPKFVYSIASTAFVECDQLTEFNVARTNRYYHGEDGMLLRGKKLIAYPSAEGKVVIRSDIGAIGDYAFSVTNVTEVVVHKGINSIGVCAFAHTYKLKKLTLKSPKASAIVCSCALHDARHDLKVYVPKKAYAGYVAKLRGGEAPDTIKIIKSKK